MAEDLFFDQFQTVDTSASTATAAPEEEFFGQFETVETPRNFSAITDQDIAIASQRFKQNEEIERELGGTPLNPVTGEPSYTSQQRQADLNILSLAEARQRGAQASAQGQRLSRMEGASPLMSGAAGVASIPVALGGLGLTLGSKIPGLGQNVQPGLDQALQAQEILSNIASQNPITAAASQSAAGALLGGGGGAVQRGAQALSALGRGNLSAAGRLAGQSLAQGAPGATVVPAFSTGVRALSGEDTSLNDLLTEAALGYASSGRIQPGTLSGMTLGTNVGGRVAESLRSSAKRNIEQALGATTKTGKEQASRVAEQILDRPFGETFAFTRKGLQTKAEAGAEKAGEAIDAFGKLEGKVSPKKILDALDKEKQNFIVDNIEVDPDSIRRIEQTQEIFQKFGDDINLESLRGIRRIFDKEISKSKGFFKTTDQGSMLEIKKLASKNIRGILADEVPDLAKLNKEFNFWSNLEDVITTTNKRTGPQTQTMANIATIGGAVSGATLPDAASKALLFRGITQAVRSPGWKLASARIKNTIANALSSGDESEVISAIGKVPEFNAAPLADELLALKKNPPESPSALAVEPSPSPTLPSSSTSQIPFEKRVEELIKTYPSNIRKDTKLAKKVAEAELGVTFPSRPGFTPQIIPANNLSSQIQDQIDFLISKDKDFAERTLEDMILSEAEKARRIKRSAEATKAEIKKVIGE